MFDLGAGRASVRALGLCDCSVLCKPTPDEPAPVPPALKYQSGSNRVRFPHLHAVLIKTGTKQKINWSATVLFCESSPGPEARPLLRL